MRYSEKPNKQETEVYIKEYLEEIKPVKAFVFDKEPADLYDEVEWLEDNKDIYGEEIIHDPQM